jgi:hypothetical protein
MPAKSICGSSADAGLLVEATVAGVAIGVPLCVGCGVTVPVNTGDGTAVAAGVAVGDKPEGDVDAVGVVPAGSDCEEVLAATAAGEVLVSGAKLICGSRAACIVA